MKCPPLLFLFVFVFRVCDAQYDITVDAQLSEWSSDSAFSVNNGTTCYLGWWNVDFTFGLQTDFVLNSLNVFFYFNAQPFQEFSTGSDPGSSSGITTQFGTQKFPFNAEAVAVWTPSEGLQLFEWNSNWTVTENATQSANATGIIEGKVFNASSILATNGFTSIWVQLCNVSTNECTSLPGDNLAFTFPLLNYAIGSTWKGYVSGFPATVQASGSLNDPSIWLGGYNLTSANNTSFLIPANSSVSNGDITSVNVALSGGLNVTSGTSVLKLGHTANSWSHFSSYPSYYQPADIIFDAAPIHVPAPLQIGAPARVIWRNYPLNSSVRLDTLSLFLETTGSNWIQMEFHQNFSLSVTTVNIYPGALLKTNLNSSSIALNYTSNSNLLYKNSSTIIHAYRTDEWPLDPYPPPYLITIERNVILHTQLNVPVVLSAQNILVQGTLRIDGYQMDNRLITQNLTLTSTGQLNVYTRYLSVMDQFIGGTESNVQCQVGFGVLLKNETLTWPTFSFGVWNGTGNYSFLSNSTSVITTNNAVSIFIDDPKISSSIIIYNSKWNMIGGPGNNITLYAPFISDYYVLSATHSKTGCVVWARFVIPPAPSPSPTPTPSSSASVTPSVPPPSPTTSPTPSSSPSATASTTSIAFPSISVTPSRSALPSASTVASLTPTPTASSIPIPSKSPTSPKTSTNTKSSSSPLLGLLAIVGVIPVAAIAIFIIKKRSRNTSEHSEVAMTDLSESPSTSQSNSDAKFPLTQVVTDSSISLNSSATTQVTPTPKQPVSRSTSANWEIDFNEIKILHELGRGAFGIVYKCKWRNTECVVKQIDQENAMDFSSQVKEANNIRNIRTHPNVCLVFGVCTNPQYPVCIVMEYLPEGSLDNLLYEDRIIITPQRMLEFAKSIASGMSHVHKENILHCDLACRNILVEQKRHDKYVLKIADFGLSRVMEANEYKASPSSAFPIRWTAPEALRSGKLSRAADIWSYGVTLWEIAEAKRPYPELNNSEVLEWVCDRGLRLPKPKRIQLPDKLWALMQACWVTASERPSFDAICTMLDEIEEEYFGTTSNVETYYATIEQMPSDGTTKYSTTAQYIQQQETIKNNKPEE